MPRSRTRIADGDGDLTDIPEPPPVDVEMDPSERPLPERWMPADGDEAAELAKLRVGFILHAEGLGYAFDVRLPGESGDVHVDLLALSGATILVVSAMDWGGHVQGEAGDGPWLHTDADGHEESRRNPVEENAERAEVVRTIAGQGAIVKPLVVFGDRASLNVPFGDDLVALKDLEALLGTLVTGAAPADADLARARFERMLRRQDKRVDLYLDASDRSQPERSTTPEEAGREGEELVKRALDDGGWQHVHDIMLPRAVGHAQVDHLALVGSTLVVIETKHLAGVVRGWVNDERWVQSKGGQQDRPFQNPVMQNSRHVEAARKVAYTTVPIRSLVVFTGSASIEVIRDPRMVRLNELSAALEAIDAEADPFLVNRARNAFGYLRRVSSFVHRPSADAMHLKRARDAEEGISFDPLHAVPGFLRKASGTAVSQLDVAG